MSPKKPKPPARRPPENLAVGSVPAIPISRRSGDACARVDRVAEYLDGVLDPAAQDELLEHLADCQICQAALHGEVQLRDREDELRAAAAPAASVSRADQAPPTAAEPARAEAPSDPSSLDRARQQRAARWRLSAGLAAMAAVAAAGLFVVRALPGSSSPTGADSGSAAAPVQLALAAKRPFEARLSWGPAAAHRPYEPMRSSTAALGEAISLEVRARLEKQKDCAGLAATALLAGDTATAERQYADPACASPDAQADRAALAVTLRNYDRALELCDAVLAERPDHAVALWNRALALRGKGLGLAAAAAFDRVVAVEKDEAWRAEAARLAAAARAAHQRAERDWREILELGDAMIPDGPILPLDLAKRVPGRARLRFHDAVRTATSRERLEDLRPLARAIQEPGETSLEAAIDAAARRLSPARAALIPHYVVIFRAQSVEGDAEWPAWQAKARAAGATELLLGARYRALPDDAETLRLAAASKDPWFIGLAALDQFNSSADASQVPKAEDAMRTLESLCKSSSIRFLCLKASMARAEMSLDNTLAAPTVTAALAALDMATAQGEPLLRGSAAYFVAEGERLRSAYSIARAYYEESGERARLTNECNVQQDSIAAIAAMEFDRHRFSEVQRLLRALPPCDAAPPRTLLDVQADLLTTGLPIDEVEWKKNVEKLASPANTETDQLLYSYLLNRQELRRDESSRAKLQAIAERASRSRATTASRITAAAEATLMVHAGREAKWKEVIQIAAAAHEVELPTRCALAQAKDNFQLAVAVASSTGTFDGIFRSDLGSEYRWQLPPALLDALASCDEVAVFASPPWPKGDPPLPASLPWHLVMSSSVERRASALSASDVTVIVANSQPPPEQQLATLAPLESAPPSAVVLTGAAATPARVAAEAPRAGLIEFHVHTSRVAASDAPVLALSESSSGWALTAEEVRGWHLEHHPVVLLADCSGAVPAAYDHVAWGLPAAFLGAGARAVVAPLVDIPDGEGGEFFAQIRESLRAEPNVAKVVARLRAEKIATDPASWVRNVVVFQ